VFGDVEAVLDEALKVALDDVVEGA